MGEGPYAVEKTETLLRSDARQALDQALQMLQVFGTGSDSTEYQRWLLIKGSAQAQLGATQDGARIIREVRTWAEDHGDRPLTALAHRRLSAVFRRIGDPALMLEHAVRAWELVDPSTPAPMRTDLLIGLADALGASGSFDEAIVRYREAAALAEACGDEFLQLAVVNNLAYTQYEAGAVEDALVTAKLLRDLVEGHDEPLRRHVGDTIARVYMLAGRYDEAEAVLAPLYHEVVETEDCDGLVLALLTLTEIRRLGGLLEAAEESLAAATQLIDRFELTGRRIEAMRERAEVLASRGSFEAALDQYREFHTADNELRAVQRDSRARTLNAIFEATEARRSSEHFRELSVRDPLTGLHNRRRLDESLDELLPSLRREGRRLVLGLVDLDHFKRINDTRSHAVGDEVLRHTAALLQQCADSRPGALAVRMGGEEFLVLLPDMDRDTGRRCLDELREMIAAHPWETVTSGISVTASIGVASAPDDGDDRSTLLAVADANLYRAKRAGRNAVVAEG